MDATGLGLPRGLPAVVEIVDLPPGVLRADPRLRPADERAAGRALVYGRSGADLSYEQIAYRTAAAAPHTGTTPLHTVPDTRLRQDLAEAEVADPLVDEVFRQQPLLRHRPLGVPSDIENFRFEVEDDVLHLLGQRELPDGRTAEERWSYSVTDLPEVLLQEIEERDAALTPTQQMSVGLEGTHWLRMPDLIASGRFSRFQEVRDTLRTTTVPGRLYVFVSHRWLTPTHPDPLGRQAQYTAWQLFAALCEAVRVAAQRGLHEPRRASRMIGAVVGPRGGELAETLIVNVLRFALDDSLATAADEARALEAVTGDAGVPAARDDTGLERLREIVAGAPTLAGLLERISLWYDFTCLPQPPRTEEDEALFRLGLAELSPAQILAHSVLLLDDAQDYLSRGWCVLEALTAGVDGRDYGLLVGLERTTARKGEVEGYFDLLIQDRPHLVWRAVLDTELFGVQTPAECMARLGLALTDPKDLEFVYGRIVAMSSPRQIHVDDSEILTGVLPLLASDGGEAVLLSRDGGRAVLAGGEDVHTGSLDWTDALSLRGAVRGRDAGELEFDEVDVTATVGQIAPLRNVPDVGRVTPGGGQDTPTRCHIAVIGACEGEAMLLADWAFAHRADVEELLGVAVTSVSWLATDIAPVGQLPVGRLEAVGVEADVWVVASMQARFRHCNTTGLLTEPARRGGWLLVELEVDVSEGNVRYVVPQVPEDPEARKAWERLREESLVWVEVGDDGAPSWPGGLYGWQMPGVLL